MFSFFCIACDPCTWTGCLGCFVFCALAFGLHCSFCSIAYHHRRLSSTTRHSLLRPFTSAHHSSHLLHRYCTTASSPSTVSVLPVYVFFFLHSLRAGLVATASRFMRLRKFFLHPACVALIILSVKCYSLRYIIMCTQTSCVFYCSSDVPNLVASESPDPPSWSSFTPRNTQSSIPCTCLVSTSAFS